MSIEQEAKAEAAKRFPTLYVKRYFEQGYIARASRPVEVTDEMVEKSARAGHEYLRAMRPQNHGPYAAWEELDGDFREYLRGIHRVALTAAFGVPPAEVEWEYGVARDAFPSSPAYTYSSREKCERFVKHPPVGTPSPKGPWLILQRRKAGPWVSVSSERKEN